MMGNLSLYGILMTLRLLCMRAVVRAGVVRAGSDQAKGLIRIDNGRKAFKNKAKNSLKPNFLRPKMAV